MWKTAALPRFINKVSRWGQQDLQLSNPMGEKKALQKPLTGLDLLKQVGDCTSTNPTMLVIALELLPQNQELDQYENSSITGLVHSNNCGQQGLFESLTLSYSEERSLFKRFLLMTEVGKRRAKLLK